MNEDDQQIGGKGKPWQVALRRFFSRLSVELGIGALVVFSVFLTLYEFSLEMGPNVELNQAGGVVISPLFGRVNVAHLHWVMMLNDIVTGIFACELLLRYFAASSKRKFFSEFWLDILATLPMFRIFRAARALRLLRLVRVIRLLGIVTRVSSHYPHVVRRGALDFLVVCGIIVLAVLFGAAAMTHAERGAAKRSTAVATGGADAIVAGVDVANPDMVGSDFNLENSFWFSVYTLFAGEPVPQIPRTILGKLISVFLMFMGLTMFALIAGTVSAFMIDRIRNEGRLMEFDELENHIVICGWTAKTETIIREYRANRETKSKPIVVIAESADETLEIQLQPLKHVFLIRDDFTKVSALQRAGIARATTCLVLADLTGGRSEQDADARTILAALTVEKINHSVYTCAELINRDYSSHLELGQVNNFVVSDEYGAYMLAQASIHQGLVNVLEELLSYQQGNEFQRTRIPSSWIGESFDEKLTELKASQNAILLAVHSQNGEAQINPDHYQFCEGDEVVAICREGLKLN